MSAEETKVDVVCTRCGTTFSTFLRHMAEHNQKIVCPKCGQQPAAVNHPRPTAGADSPQKT